MATLSAESLDCAPRFWISACRKACSEAVELLVEVSAAPDAVEVEPVLVVLPVVVLGGVVVPVAAPAVAPVAVEAALVELALAGVSALTSAWKSCCSFERALSLEVEVEPEDDGFARLCSRFCRLLARLP